MFNNDIRVEAVPGRVYELCKIIAKGENDINVIKEKLMPPELNNDYSYFGPIRDAAIELKLIKLTDRATVTYIGDDIVLKNIETFRRYCNSIVWQNRATRFYNLGKIFLDSNLEWLKYKSFSSDIELLGLIRASIGEDSDLQRHLLGERFWLSFLGFGFIETMGDNMHFLPNMYTALKDFISLSKIEAKKEMDIETFINNIEEYASVAVSGTRLTNTLNYAFSSALRQLHDNKEITLKRNLDSKKIWHLYPMDSHLFQKEISHITINKEIK